MLRRGRYAAFSGGKWTKPRSRSLRASVGSVDTIWHVSTSLPQTTDDLQRALISAHLPPSGCSLDDDGWENRGSLIPVVDLCFWALFWRGVASVTWKTPIKKKEKSGGFLTHSQLTHNYTCHTCYSGGKNEGQRMWEIKNLFWVKFLTYFSGEGICKSIERPMTLHNKTLTNTWIRCPSKKTKKIVYFWQYE